MDSPLTFARHFARLVWLLLSDESAFDAQIASLTAVVNAARHTSLSLTRREWQLVVNGEAVPDELTGAQDLAAQLIGHSIVEVRADRGASPTDLLLLARILATEPIPGDGGRNVLARLKALDARTVHAQVESLDASRSRGPAGASLLAALDPGLAPAATSGAEPSRAGGVQAPPVVPPGSGDEIVRGYFADDALMISPTAVTPKGSMDHLVQQLDAARGATAIARYLDALVDLAIDSVRKERFDIVADVFHALVMREAQTDDKVAKRLFGLCIRRLSTPTTLRCVAELLPRRQEKYEQYLAIFARAEDVGAEALVEALISAPSIVNRRVYYDALLRGRTGVRVLMHMLGDPRWYVVRNAVELLGEMRMTEAERELTRLLEHQDDRVRSAAAAALAKLGTAPEPRDARTTAMPEPLPGQPPETGSGSTKFVDSLVRALEREEDSRVQMTMLASIGQLGTPIAIERLTEIARSDVGVFGKQRPMHIRVAAVQVLGDVRAPGALAALQALLRDKEKAIRGAASWVLMGRRRERVSGGEE